MITFNALMDIISSIKEQVDEIKRQERISDMDYGTLLGLAEALTMIQEACSDEDRAALGIDFDIDKETFSK